MKKTIFLFLIFFLSVSLTIQASIVKVEKIFGRVEFRKLSDNKWRKLKINQKLSEDYRIRAGKNSKVVLVCKDGSRITLRNLVVFDIKELKTTPKKNTSSFKLIYGKVKAMVKKLKRKEDNWTISTPTAVAGVRGTTFGVSVYRERKTRVAVFSGAVKVKNIKKIKQKPVIVKASQVTTIKKDAPAKKPVHVKENSFEEWATRLEIEKSYSKEDFIKW